VLGEGPTPVRNVSDRDAVAFVVHAPGAPMENFSRAAADLAAEGYASMEAVLAIATPWHRVAWTPAGRSECLTLSRLPSEDGND